MHIPRTPRTRCALAAATLLALAACASTPPRNAALDEASARYARAAGDAQVARSAPMELRRAQQSLRQAEAALNAGEEREAVEHHAYLARQRTEVALEAAKAAQAEQAVAEASQRRSSIIIDARTRDADAQRAAAEKARLEAEAQRNQAEAARKLAEERLAAAQASQARAATASARARTLEEQLAQLKAKQTERGMVLTLGDVLFDTGRADLNPGAGNVLNQLAEFLRQNPERTIEIEGYTDAVGSAGSNQVLSERRANAVKNALMDRGIASQRISARGFGEERPVASNSTPAGRQQNRRVEVVLPGTS